MSKLSTFKKESKTNLVIGSIVALLIAITPYLFYLYRSLPNERVWDTSFFKFESIYYEDISYFFWIFMSKAIPLLVLILWFFTCKHWWYHVIIIPISMYCFQI